MGEDQYRFSLKVATLDDLEARRQGLERQALEVSPIIDLGSAKSVLFADPNDIQLEFCCHTRRFDEADLQRRTEVSVALPA